MKEQLEKLGLEMIQEIKDLKDLAKGELPEVAKEYVNYLKVSSLLGFIFFGALALGSAYLMLLGYFSPKSFDDKTFGGMIGVFLFSIPALVYFGNYLEVKMQPRRMAIKAITELL